MANVEATLPAPTMFTLGLCAFFRQMELVVIINFSKLKDDYFILGFMLQLKPLNQNGTLQYLLYYSNHNLLGQTR